MLHRRQTIEPMALVFTYLVWRAIYLFRDRLVEREPMTALPTLSVIRLHTFSSREEYRIATSACGEIESDAILQSRCYSDWIKKVSLQDECAEDV